MVVLTTTSDAAWRPDINTVAPADVAPEALILRVSTQIATVEGDRPAVRAGYIPDLEIGFVPEGGPIPSVDPDLAETVINTGKLAVVVPVSREQLAQEPNDGQSEITKAMQRSVTLAADNALISTPAPTGGTWPPPGLLAIGGFTDGGTVGANLDVLVDLEAEVRSQGAQPSLWLLSPRGWATLMKIKATADSNSSLIGAGTTAAEQMLLGTPVIVNKAMPDDRGLLIDKSQVLSAIGRVEVAASDDFYFDRDTTALRIVWRFGVNIVRPQRIGSFALSVPVG